VKRADLVISVVFFLMGIWVLWQASMLPQFSVFGPGPEFMPSVLAILLLLLSAILFVTTLRKATPDTESPMPDRQAVFRISVIVGCLFLYVALLDRIGYLPLTFAYCLFMLAALGRYRWYTNVIVAAAITGFVYWSFIMVLGVPAPRGMLDF
jgi:putative tricarboxylic transport membrane protein